MKIQDRTNNAVICNVHPLLASEALRRSGGDKYRIQWISAFQCVVWNPGQGRDIDNLRRAAGDAWEWSTARPVREWCDRSWHDGDCCDGSRAQWSVK